MLPDPRVMDYGAAKEALTDFCMALSKEVSPRGVGVNTVRPGPVATQLWLGAGASRPPSPSPPVAAQKTWRTGRQLRR